MFAFDLKSGYHHVDIADVHHKYLGFAWKEKFYVFTVAAFINAPLIRNSVRNI